MLFIPSINPYFSMDGLNELKFIYFKVLKINL
jgi:hypothetical protein